MAIAFVRQATGTANVATTAVVTITAAVAGNCLVAVIEGNNAAVTGIVGGGVTWVLLKAGPASGNFAEIWYGLNSSGSGTSVTVTYASAVTGAVNVSEFSGIKTSGAADSVTNSGGGPSASPSSGAVTPTAAPALVLAMVAGTTALTSGPTGGFTALTQAIQGANRANGAYLIQTTPASATATWTYGGSGNWDTAIGVLLGVPDASVRAFFIGGGFFP